MTAPTTESPYAEVSADEREVLERLSVDTPYWSENLAKIVPKGREVGLIPLKPKPAQLALDGLLEEQRLAGKPQRAIVLKARQVGISTWIQAKLIQRSTLSAHHNALVVAHDSDTGAKLFAIGQRMYSALPNEAPLKPYVRSHRRARFLHFGQRGEAWMDAPIYPDSTYFVDTAGEFEAGRGATYHAVHMSEFAFWPQPEQKLTAVGQAIPRDPSTLAVIESTANGHNKFKDLWDDAVEGRSGYVAFFWPWWKEDEYRFSFMEGEREEFRIGDTEQSPYAEGEEELVDPGPIDTLTGEPHPLDLEQLKWRRWAIADPDRGGGSMEKFHQEYPSTPEEAFLSTGSKVFEPMLVAKAMARAEKTDPRTGAGGPLIGRIEAGARPMRAGRFGKIEVPTEPSFKSERNLLPGEAGDWRIWPDPPESGREEEDRIRFENGELIIPEARLFVVGNDVSAGIPESEDDTGDPAYHAIQVIDHATKEQVAEYRSRCDPDLLAEHALLIATLFNEAWLAPEVTGGWGLPVARKIWLDYRYRFMYFRRKHDAREESQVDRLGWDTNRATKPILIAGGQELLREGTHGIKSRRLVGEMLTYIRLPSGKTLPEKGRFADLLLAWLIAQQVALELPLRQMKKGKKAAGYQPRNRVTGY